MAGVVIDAEQTVEPSSWDARRGVAERNESSRAAFQQAERLGLEAEMQFPAGLPADVSNVFDGVPKIFADELDFICGEGESFERAGQGADAAFTTLAAAVAPANRKAGWCKPRRSGEVQSGTINLFLDARAVKPAVGKSVDGENIAVVFFEPAVESQQLSRSLSSRAAASPRRRPMAKGFSGQTFSCTASVYCCRAAKVQPTSRRDGCSCSRRGAGRD